MNFLKTLKESLDQVLFLLYQIEEIDRKYSPQHLKIECCKSQFYILEIDFENNYQRRGHKIHGYFAHAPTK